MDTHELAWAAGFFDGEGSIAFHQHNDKYRSRGICLMIGQRDRFVLDRFKTAVRFGTIRGPFMTGEKKTRLADGRVIFHYELSKFEHVQAVVAMIWKYLSPVKKAQAKKVLQTYLTHPTLPPREARLKAWETRRSY